MLNIHHLSSSARQHAGVFSALAILITMNGAATPCAAQCGYEITAIIEGPDCGLWGNAELKGYDLNEQGHIVGKYMCVAGPDHAFAWYGAGPVVDLPMPPGTADSRAVAIDEDGCIIGSAAVSGSGFSSVGFWSDGQTTEIILPLPGANNCSVWGMNYHDQIVGDSLNTVTGKPPLQAYLRQNGEMIDLSPIVGTENSRATDINNLGHVTGEMGETVTYDAHAFIWDGTTVLDLGVMPNGMTAEPRAINDAGHVVGRGKVYVPDPPDWEYHAFLWDGEEIIDLGTLPFCENSFASDINNDGIIVGRSGIPSIAFLWRDGQMHRLNDLVHPPFPGSLRGANAINEAGQIVAYGYGNFDGLVTVLLSPIPPPIGDLDGDCTVGVADLMILLSEWGSSVSPADLNGDHIVDVVDLLILLDNWS